PRWIGAIDDIYVVIAGQHDHARGESRIARRRFKEFGPFRRAAGIGHIAADEHEIERMCGMDGREAGYDTIEAFVAARTSTSALDAKAVSLTDDVKVRKMSHAPGSAAGRRGIEGSEVERLVHAGI